MPAFSVTGTGFEPTVKDPGFDQIAGSDLEQHVLCAGPEGVEYGMYGIIPPSPPNAETAGFMPAFSVTGTGFEPTVKEPGFDQIAGSDVPIRRSAGPWW